MRTAAKVIVRIVVIMVLFAIGFAVGFPLGRQTGFLTGSEWAIVQAAIAAKEAGVTMPVTFEDGQMHVVVKQPEGIYQRARQRAALDPEDGMRIVRRDSEEQGGPAERIEQAP